MNVQRAVGAKKKDLTAGSWGERERALESRLSRDETVYGAAAMSDTPKNV